MDPSPSQKRRSFKIRTSFGTARQWRSRKNPPCDACRRRKTACIIESEPPCRFCHSRGLVCKSTDSGLSPTTLRQRSQGGAEEFNHDDPGDDGEVADAAPAYDSMSLSISPNIEQSILAARTLSTPSSQSSHRQETGEWPAISSVSPATYGRLSPAGLNDVIPQLRTLEDNVNRTAHSMGLSGEQDPDLLTVFRSVIMNEQDGVSADVIQVTAGDPDIVTLPVHGPIHFNLLHDEFQPADDRAKLNSSEMIEGMVSPHAASLVRLFFKHVHPVYCVVSKVRFLEAYVADRLKIPASLRGAIYGLGSMFWQHDPDVDGVLSFDLHDLFEEAQSSLQREFHAPNLWKLQACLLLLYERPADNATIETPRTWVFSSHIVSSAQIIGLHRDPTTWQLSLGEKKLRRKLWWATYVADIWSSVCHGNPPLVYPASFTTAPPEMDDLTFDEDVPGDLQDMVDVSSRAVDTSTGVRFLEMVKLSRILHELIDGYYLDSAHEQTITQPQIRETNILAIQKDLENWSSMVPNCVTMGYSETSTAFRNNAPLNLAYFAVQALVFRALMSPARMTAKSDPGSALCRHFDHAVTEFRNFTIFMGKITQPCLHAFWGGHARSQLTLCGNFLIYLFLLAPNPTQVHATFELLGSFHESLQRLREWANDDASLGLLRPVALRIDSFFLHAARIMRNGMGGIS